MNYEDSRNALFCEPNAYALNYKANENGKKIIFAEPYENIPNYYINNNFKKSENNQEDNKCNCDCNNNKHLSNQSNSKPHNSTFLGGFNLQGLAPILSMFGGGADLSKFSSLLNTGGQSGVMNIVSKLLSSGGGISSVLNMFKQDSKMSKHNKEIKSTDYEISHYTRVEWFNYEY